MVGGGTYLEINLQREQRINELKTLYTIDELINHCYEEEQEVERLNNVIDELEKDLEDIFYGRGQHFMDSSVVPIKYVLDKLKELKGSDISER